MILKIHDTLLNRLKVKINENKLIPSHQFGFTDNIKKTLEERRVCPAVFLNVPQAFDKVWHEGLIHKLKKFFPK